MFINYQDLNNAYSREVFDVNFAPRKLGGLKVYFKSSPKAPEPPDPVATANAQAAANKETAIAQAFLNNTNQTNPYGSIEYNAFKDPETGLDRFSSTTKLNPEAQKAFDAEQSVTRGTNELAAGQIGRVSDAVSNPFSYEGLPAAPTAGLEGRQAAENAVYDTLSRRLNKQFNLDEDRLRNRLATQGITQGAEAFNNELDQFNTNKGDTFLDAANQAYLAGGAEQNRQFGLDSQARDRGIQEASFLRNIPLNEVAALLGTGSVGIPQFGAPSQTGVAPTDVIGATYGSANLANQNYAQRLNSANAFNQGLFGLGSSGLGAGAYFFK